MAGIDLSWLNGRLRWLHSPYFYTGVLTAWLFLSPPGQVRRDNMQDGAVLVAAKGCIPRWLVQPDNPAARALIIEGAGASEVVNLKYGTSHVWNPSYPNACVGQTDIFAGMPAPGEEEWLDGRGIYTSLEEVWLYDMTLVGKAPAGRLWKRFSDPVCHPQWSRDGRVVVLVRLRPSGPEVWKIQYPDGQAAPVPGLKGCIDPALSPDGTRIACARGGDLWIASLDGGALGRLRLHGARWPDWAPNGRQLAFQRWLNGQWDIWTAEPESGRLTRVTWNPAPDIAPSWSGMGEVALGSFRNGQWEIWSKQVSPPQKPQPDADECEL